MYLYFAPNSDLLKATTTFARETAVTDPLGVFYNIPGEWMAFFWFKTFICFLEAQKIEVAIIVLSDKNSHWIFQMSFLMYTNKRSQY